MRGALGALLVVTWVLAAHRAGHDGSAAAAALALAALGTLAALPALASPQAARRALGAAAWLAWLLALAFVLRARWAAALLDLPPVALPLLLALAFARTLRPGREPLITRFVRLTEGPQQAGRADVGRYTRRLTGAWVALLLGLALSAAALTALRVPGGWLALAGLRPPLAVPPSAWNDWVNGWAYAIPALAVGLELALRRRLLPEAPPVRPLRFALQLARHWRELRAP